MSEQSKKSIGNPAGLGSRRMAQLAKRLAAYSAAAAATATASAEKDGQAALVVHEIADLTVADTPGNLFNMVSGSVTEATVSFLNSTSGVIRVNGFSQYYPNPYLYGPAHQQALANAAVGFAADGTAGPNGYVNVALLGRGVSIDDGLSFGANNSSVLGNWAAVGTVNWPVGTRGFAGVRFVLNDQEHFGWFELTRNPTGTGALTVHAFAYNDDPGQPAVTTPEPSYGLFLLALGAVGTKTWRQRKSSESDSTIDE